MFSMVQHLARQAAFSRATFGPGARTLGVQKHIAKEFHEINELKDEADRCHEWVDVAILGFDGLLRSISVAQPTWTFDRIAERALEMFVGKQGRNEMRTWPDWRGQPEDVAIEHDRTGEAPKVEKVSLVVAINDAKAVADEMVGTPWRNRKTGNLYLVRDVDLDSETLLPRVRYTLLEGGLYQADRGQITWSRDAAEFKVKFEKFEGSASK